MKDSVISINNQKISKYKLRNARF